MKRILVITMLVLFVTGAQATEKESQSWFSWLGWSAVYATGVIGAYETALLVSPAARALKQRCAPVATGLLFTALSKLGYKLQPQPGFGAGPMLAGSEPDITSVDNKKTE